MKQFLPISRADMEAQGIKQLDFVYVIGDAYVDHPPSGTRSSAEYYRQTVLRWESFRSRTGRSGQHHYSGRTKTWIYRNRRKYGSW